MWDWSYLSSENNSNFSRVKRNNGLEVLIKLTKCWHLQKEIGQFPLNLSIMSLVRSILSWAELTGEVYCLHSASNSPSQWGVGPSTANLSLDAISSCVNKAWDYCSMLNMWWGGWRVLVVSPTDIWRTSEGNVMDSSWLRIVCEGPNIQPECLPNFTSYLLLGARAIETE